MPPLLHLWPILIELAPSILACDFAHLADQASLAVDGGATILHVDAMDGHFVPNFTIGPPVVAALRKYTKAILDCHLMIAKADEYIPAFADAGADWISVHQEACPHLNRTLQLIKGRGLNCGVVLNPATPVHTLTEVLDIVDLVLIMSVNPGFGGQKFLPSSVRKIEQLVEMREAGNARFRIEVDGGITGETAPLVVRAGAEILVVGSAVFGEKDPTEAARRILQSANQAVRVKA